MNRPNKRYPLAAGLGLALLQLLPWGGGAALAQAPSTSRNFVVETTVKTAGKRTAAALAGLPVDSANRTIRYLDGLGRPLQTVQWQGSPTKRDVVQQTVYDALGREAVRYQPYAEQAAGDGAFKPAALAGQSAFYGGTGWDANVKKTPFPFSQTVFEPSPLNRVLEQGAPGSTWQPAASRTASGGRTVVQAYGTNTGAQPVKLWSVNSSGASATGSYADGRLYRTVSKDENWTSGNIGTVDEYKDLEGRVVLKRIWETELLHLDTYYLYDDLGNLRYVVPPAVTTSSFSESDPAFDQYIYGYRYDGRKRLTRKKLPGRGWAYMAYNRLDQLVLSQDANQRAKSPQEWTVTKYDVHGRTAITGTYLHSAAAGADQLGTIQGLVDAQPYQWEERIGSGIGYTVDRTFPMAPLAVNLSVSYYDNYAIPGLPVGYATVAAAHSSKLKGLPTAGQTNVLGTTTMLWSVLCYDDDGRVVETLAQHYKGGSANEGNYDRATTVYSFAGEVLATTRKHLVGGVQQLLVQNRYRYDHMGRKLEARQRTGNSGAATIPMVVLAKHSYNELGQLKQKQLHGTDVPTFLQQTAFAYNERGWLKNSSSAEFSMQLDYQDGSIPQFNGNIANQRWGSALGNVYTYQYDGLNRLTSAISTGIVMGEVLTYDVMGNIKSLTRSNASGSASGTYSYTGNRLNSIAGGLATGSYGYDANGNATTDGRTGVNLTYNHLDLPVTASKAGLSLAYTYDASGRKLRKLNATTATTTDYIGGVQYTNGEIEFVQTEEGLARRNGTNYSYEYNLTDHLGNVRYTFNRHPVTGALTALQNDDYYAFGKRFANAGDNKYLYNGKELQEELGQYDYGARFYDPIIGRWNVVDPLAEVSRRFSPYVYGNNNPIRFIDPDGMMTTDANGNISSDNAEEAQAMLRQLQSQYSSKKDDDKKKDKDKVPLSGAEQVAIGLRNYGGDYSGSAFDWSMYFLDQLNQFNPIANIWDAITGSIDGTDRLGNPQSDTETGLKYVSVVPIGKVTGAVAKTLGKVELAMMRKGMAMALANSNNISHIMQAKHGLEGILKIAGSERNVVRRLFLSLGQQSSLPASGTFERIINVYGKQVTVRGAVVDGTPRIATAFIP